MIFPFHVLAEGMFWDQLCYVYSAPAQWHNRNREVINLDVLIHDGTFGKTD
jgi:hypothetical protein